MNFNFSQQSLVEWLVDSKFHLSALNKLFCNSSFLFVHHYLLLKVSPLRREAFENDDFLGWLAVEGRGEVVHRLFALPTRLIIVNNNTQNVNFQSIYLEFIIIILGLYCINSHNSRRVTLQDINKLYTKLLVYSRNKLWFYR